MNRVLTLSLDGEFTFRLHITKEGKLARLEIKKFNEKDDKYKDAKTEYLGKVLKMSDLEKVLRESKEFDEIRPMSAEEFTNWLKDQYKKIFGDRYDDNLATESASKLIAANDDNIENAKREAESIIKRMHRQDEKHEMFDNLAAIKTLLCDAPEEVKSSFNEVVKYFAESENWYVFKHEDGDIFSDRGEPNLKAGSTIKTRIKKRKLKVLAGPFKNKKDADMKISEMERDEIRKRYAKMTLKTKFRK